MSILGDWIRDKFWGEPDYGPIPEHPIEDKRDPLSGKILLPGFDKYEDIPFALLPIDDEYEPLNGSGSISSSDYSMTTLCSTAMEDFPVHQMTELKYEPLAEWVCQWCGNMYPSDVHSCEKCGGPKGETND
jgi:hypothetical protein